MHRNSSLYQNVEKCNKVVFFQYALKFCMVCLSSVFLIIFIVIWLINVLSSYFIRRKSVHPNHANKSMQIAPILYAWKPWHRYILIIANNQSHHYLSSSKYIVFLGIIVNHHQQELKRIVRRLTVGVVKASCCINCMNAWNGLYIKECLIIHHCSWKLDAILCYILVDVRSMEQLLITFGSLLYILALDHCDIHWCII